MMKWVMKSHDKNRRKLHNEIIFNKKYVIKRGLIVKNGANVKIVC